MSDFLFLVATTFFCLFLIIGSTLSLLEWRHFITWTAHGDKATPTGTKVARTGKTIVKVSAIWAFLGTLGGWAVVILGIVLKSTFDTFAK